MMRWLGEVTPSDPLNVRPADGLVVNQNLILNKYYGVLG